MSADINNYYIGKGIVEVKAVTDTDWIDIGNCPTFEFTPDLTTLEHYSSRQGVKTKDRTVVTEKKGTLKLVMEEWTSRNLAMAVLGTIEKNSEGQDEIDIFASNAIALEVRFRGTNEVGPKWQLHFPKVDFVPSAALSPISDEWGQLEVNGEVAAVNGKFGTATKIADGA
ncbi:hypothetical protein ACJMQP_04150 [Rhodopseudomonas palustris]